MEAGESKKEEGRRLKIEGRRGFTGVFVENYKPGKNASA